MGGITSLCPPAAAPVDLAKDRDMCGGRTAASSPRRSALHKQLRQTMRGSDVARERLQTPVMEIPKVDDPDVDLEGWTENLWLDGSGGSRAAHSPYSPKSNVFSDTDDMDAVMDAIERGVTETISTAGAAPLSVDEGMRLCHLKWSSDSQCQMIEEHEDGRVTCIFHVQQKDGVWSINEDDRAGEQRGASFAEEGKEEKDGKEGVFRLCSDACERCDKELQLHTCGACGAKDPSPRSEDSKGSGLLGGVRSLFGGGKGMPPRRQMLMEVRHSKAAMNTSATAHVMEVDLPGLYNTEDKGECRVVWCPRTPRVKGAKDCIELKTKLPKWNKQTKSLVLDFSGRVKKASARNFQLCPKEGEGKDEHVFLQYGKVKKNHYALDFRHPLSPLQALGIALSVKKWQ